VEPSVPGWALAEVPFGIALLTVPDLTIVYANKLYESWYQPDRRPIVGKHLQEALAAAPQVLDTFRDVAARGEPAHFHDSEFVGLKGRPVVLPGDLTKWDWSIWPLRNGAGAVTHLLVSGYDVTASASDRLQLGRAHEEGIRALLEISRLADVSGSLEDFFGELSASVARLVGAGKVLFARAAGGAMFVQPRTHGFNDEVLAGLSVPCSPDGDGLADRIVYHDAVFRASIDASPEFEAYRDALAVMEVADAIAVGWRVGDLRLGLVAAFNSTREGGFNEEDLHILRTSSMAAGLVWQHREARSRLAEAQRDERERLTAAAERMAALERTKADFLRLASHEMRGPISVVSVYASMLAEGSLGQVSEGVHETSVIIAAKIRELNRMVDQILEASRLDDPTLPLNVSTFDVREIVPHAIEQVHEGRKQQHQLKVDIGADPVFVRADRDRVLMIVANLIDNAIKYSPQGGEIHCVTVRSGGRALVRVTDHGIGIAQGDLPRLFSRFSRVGGARTEAIPGTGLGLYLCKEAARLQGGDITVESTLGEGSTFTLELPAAVRLYDQD
jgi:signal transduction histidine kinase